MLPRHAPLCSLSSLLQRTQPSVKLFLELAESRILAAPADTSHLIVHCPAPDSLCRSLFGGCLSLRPLVLSGAMVQWLERPLCSR